MHAYVGAGHINFLSEYMIVSMSSSLNPFSASEYAGKMALLKDDEVERLESAGRAPSGGKDWVQVSAANQALYCTAEAERSCRHILQADSHHHNS